MSRLHWFKLKNKDLIDSSLFCAFFLASNTILDKTMISSQKLWEIDFLFQNVIRQVHVIVAGPGGTNGIVNSMLAFISSLRYKMQTSWFDKCGKNLQSRHGIHLKILLNLYTFPSILLFGLLKITGTRHLMIVRAD
jgi:hypothetical protein